MWLAPAHSGRQRSALIGQQEEEVTVGAVEGEAIVLLVPLWHVDTHAQEVGQEEDRADGDHSNRGHLGQTQRVVVPRRPPLQPQGYRSSDVGPSTESL